MTTRGFGSPGIIVLCGCLIVCLSYGTRSGMGLYLQPMSLEYGWGRSIFSTSAAIQLLSLGILGPFAGAIADRWGTARVVALGGVFYALGLAALSYVTVPVIMYLVSGILIGGAFACTSFAVIFAVVGRVVPAKRRSAALGVATAAASFGQFVLLPITQFLISEFDWHAALLGMSVLTGLIAPLSVVLASAKPAVTSDANRQSMRSALNEAWREKGFHYLFWGYSVCGFQLTLLIVHLPAFVMDAGLKPEHGMTALALIGLFNIVGSMGAGWLGDRLSKKYLLSWLYFARAGLLMMLIVLPLTPAVLYAFAAGMGLMWLGTVTLTTGLVGQIFGLRYVAMLGSVVFLGHQLGSFSGAIAGGYLHDATGTYTGALLVAVGLSLLAAILNLPVNETPIAERPAAKLKPT